MKVKTGIKAGGTSLNHNEAQGGLKVQTGIKSGRIAVNHSEAQAKGGLKVQSSAVGNASHGGTPGTVLRPNNGRLAMKVKTGIKAGGRYWA